MRVVIAALQFVLSTVPRHCARLTYFLHPKLRKANAVLIDPKLIALALRKRPLNLKIHWCNDGQVSNPIPNALTHVARVQGASLILFQHLEPLPAFNLLPRAPPFSLERCTCSPAVLHRNRTGGSAATLV